MWTVGFSPGLVDPIEIRMSIETEYALIDFGSGRKLEQFGQYRLDRPAPAADKDLAAAPADWKQATAHFERTGKQSGRWDPPGQLPETWIIRHGPITLELKASEFGHLGLFPEQAPNWDWIARQVERWHTSRGSPKSIGGEVERPRLLNLFAYTGAATLVAAAAGAEVTHVDAAKNVIAWGRRNAALSGLADSPIRWVHEDVRKFVAREVRRGNRYDGVILDPPSYGHGAHGEAWQLDLHLPELLKSLRRLLVEEPLLVLLSAHSRGCGPARLADWLNKQVLRDQSRRAQGRRLGLRARDGRTLLSGACARWGVCD